MPLHRRNESKDVFCQVSADWKLPDLELIQSQRQVEDLEEKLQATRDQISKLESLVKVDDAGVEGPDVGSDHNGYGNFTLQKTSEKTPHTKPARPVPGKKIVFAHF